MVPHMKNSGFGLRKMVEFRKILILLMLRAMCLLRRHG